MKFFKIEGDRFLWFLALSLFFVTSFYFSLIKKETIILQAKRPDISVSPIPTLVGNEPFPILSAQGVVAIDPDSGVSLYEKGADLNLLPASTTKIMTALIAFEAYDLNDVVTISGPRVVGQKMGLLWGEQITVQNLLDGLLIYSANDAAEALASHYEGGREAFVARMNEKAKELHLINTHFVNPSGLEDVGHVSSARDLVRLAEIAMQDNRFASIVGTKEMVVTSTDEKFVHKLTNINELIGEVDGVLGVKTGWTENARENLVSYIDRDGKKVFIALLGSQDRFTETKELIEWIYSNYEWQNLSYSP